MAAMPFPARAVLRRAFAALLAFTAVFALLVGAEPGMGVGGSVETRSAGAPPGSGSAESEGAPDGSADAELRLLLGGVRRVQAPPAPPQSPPRSGPPVRSVYVPTAASARTSPARGPAPYAARCAVLRC
ncbi:hypothetical protein OG897_37840 [Streptomyces sp. NBC_00237]|uniref:hypothetical protein n=1 Tax=Streptomyces sp. NBC_00237 TaxID=2975687 RepID=UPI0022540860|nr:hypothetical protein [Streptomyces sp. NBC_00237]MCX5207155.1 hypothetical protein [Streptomyces sp. NBC_00237]